MSGPVPISGSSTFNLGTILAMRFATRALQRTTHEYYSAARQADNPTESSNLRHVERLLRRQYARYGSTLESSTTNQTRLGELISAYDDVGDYLDDIEDLIQDTIVTPGNATVNQSAINTLISTINRTITGVRGGINNPTFIFEGLDGNFESFIVDRANNYLTDADGFIVDINVTAAATRGTRTAYATNVPTAVQPITFRIVGPNGNSPNINIGATKAQITNYITGLDATNLDNVVFNLTGPDGTETITINGGATRAELIDYIDALAVTNADTVTFDLTGSAGTQSITIDGGSRAELVDYITGLDASNADTVTFNLTGSAGMQAITIDGATQAVLTDAIYDFTGGLADELEFTVEGSGGVSGTITIAAFTSRDDAITQLNTTDLAGTGVEAVASGADAITLRSTAEGAGEFVTLTQIGGSDHVVQTPHLAADQTVNGTDADDRAAAMAAINAVTGMTGIEAIAGSTGDAITLRSVAYSAAEFITVAETLNPGGEVALLGDQTVTGTDADDQAAVIAAINAVSGMTGIEAIAGSTGSAVTLRSIAYSESEFITVAETMNPGGEVTLLADQMVTGVDADLQADVIATINAVTGMTGVEAVAGTNSASVTIRTVIGGSAQFITVASVTNPAGETALAANQTRFGAELTQQQAVDAINVYSTSTGVEAVTEGSTDVTLRTVKYGTAYTFTTTIINDPEGHLLGNGGATGTDAQGTIDIEGVTANFIGMGRDVSFDVGGAEGNFTVTGDITFDPAPFTVRGGNFLPLVSQAGTLTERINFNVLDVGFLGRTASPGGLADIDVTTSTANALTIINQAIEDLELETHLADIIKDEILDPQVARLTSRVSDIEDRIENNTELQEVLRSFRQQIAQDDADNALSVIAQITDLYPSLGTGLL